MTFDTLSRAEESRRRGDYAAAAALYKKYISSPVSLPSSIATALLGLADTQRILGKFESARKNYRAAAKSSVFSSPEEDSRRARFDAAVGDALCDKGGGKYRAASAKLLRLAAEAKKRRDASARAFVLWHIGMCLRFEGKLAGSLSALRLSKKMFVKMGDRDGVGFCLCGLGGTLRALGRKTDSLENYRAASRIFDKTRDTYGRAYSLCGAANALKALGRTKEALAVYRRSAAIYGKTGDLSSLAFVHKGIAGCLARLGAGSGISVDTVGKYAAAARRHSMTAEKLFRRSRDERGLLSLYLEKLSRGFSPRLFKKALDIVRRGGYLTEKKYLKSLLKCRRANASPPKWLG